MDPKKIEDILGVSEEEAKSVDDKANGKCSFSVFNKAGVKIEHRSIRS